MRRALSSASGREPTRETEPVEEWQQYIDPQVRCTRERLVGERSASLTQHRWQSKQPYYVNLETGEAKWEQPKWFYRKGEGIDEHPALTMLRSDRLSANPHRKVPGWLKALNAALLVSLCSYFVYLYFTLEEPERKRKVAVKQRKKGVDTDSEDQRSKSKTW